MAEIRLSALKDELKNQEKAVLNAEELYTARVLEVAQRVTDSGKIRVILLAGPSGSGKTTTANLISDRIKSMGEKSMVLSLDNFYKNLDDDDMYPRDHDGERDFESPEALDWPLMLSVIRDIVEGRPFSVPKYDFKIGGRSGFTRYPSFADGCVIIEGIHGLNPRLSDPFPKDKLLKLFVSVSTNINDDNDSRIISGKKLRFVRRVVRDSIYRASDAKRTLFMWADVLRGEEKYLYPYKDTADLRFDTFHTFEVGVLKPYLMRLIDADFAKKYPYVDTVRDAMLLMPDFDESLVPETSLIREFIPGGIYEDLY